MTLTKVLYRTRVRIKDSWKKAFMMHPLFARRIHLFAGRARNSEHRLGPGERRPSTLRCELEKSSQLRTVPSTVQTGSGWFT